MSLRQTPEKILVRAPNWIGDAVISLPAVSCLKALYPLSSVTVLTKTRAVPVFLNNPDIDEVMEYDDKGRHSGVSGRVKLAGEIRKMGFQRAVLLQNAFDAALIAYLGGIPERVGYSRDLRSALLTRAIPVSAGVSSSHQVYYYLNIIKELGGQVPENPAPKIFVSKEDETWAEGFIKKNRLQDSVLVGAGPGASYGPAKRWPAKNFSEVLSNICQGGCVPVIFGGAEDAETCKLVSGGVKRKHLNLAGGITLRQFMAILKRLSVFVTNDSGPMHIASALGVPTVAIFGSTDPALTGPLGKRTRLLIKKLDCSPCFERECKYKHYRCLTEITPQEVLEAAEELMAKGGQACGGR